MMKRNFVGFLPPRN